MQLDVELNDRSGSPVVDMEETMAQDIEGRSDDNKANLELELEELTNQKKQYEQLISSLKVDIDQLLKRKAAIADDIEVANSELEHTRSEILTLTQTTRSYDEMNKEMLALRKQIDDLKLVEKHLNQKIEEGQSLLQENQSALISGRSQMAEFEHHMLGLVHTHAELAANIEAKKATLESIDEDAFDESSNDSVAEDATDAAEDAADATENAAETTATPAKEEDKKTMKQKMYSFMIAFLAHPVTKSATVVVFTAGLLALGATLANILTLAVAATISVVGLFAGGYTYHRAQASKKLEAAKTVATTGEEKPAEEPANTAKETAVPVTTTVVDSTEKQANDDQEDTSEKAAISSPGM